MAPRGDHCAVGRLPRVPQAQLSQTAWLILREGKSPFCHLDSCLVSPGQVHPIWVRSDLGGHTTDIFLT